MDEDHNKNPPANKPSATGGLSTSVTLTPLKPSIPMTDEFPEVEATAESKTGGKSNSGKGNTSEESTEDNELSDSETIKSNWEEVRGSDSMSSVSSWVTMSSSESDVENTPSTSGQGNHEATLRNLYHSKPKSFPSRFVRKPALDPCKEIHAKLDRKCPFTVSLKSVRHIWNGHGHYQNAKREAATRKKRNGKIPSYFENRKILIRSIYSTSVRPNWTRLAQNPKGSGKNSKNNARKRMKKKMKSGRYKQLNKTAYADNALRTFSFKRFKKRIGYSGMGYSKTKRTIENVDCKCCGVLVDSRRGLVTAFPMITDDAHMQGVGQKTHLSDESSSISSDDTINSLGMSSYTDASISTISTSSEAPSSETPSSETPPSDARSSEASSSEAPHSETLHSETSVLDDINDM